ncbi:MAG: Hsp70 family protein [Acidobacteriota bacterium]|jgi:molecular chaperone DnaK (HSP70)|nr:Hsp70 family protein [Acidobacteriota bacterium]
MGNDLDIFSATGTQLQKASAPLRVIGIDLGTTNSTVAEIVLNDIEKNMPPAPKCIEVEQETYSGLYTHILTPSAVALYDAKEWIGEGAKRLLGRVPELGLRLTQNLFLECKNDIGTRRTYPNAPEGYRSPVDISSRILEFLKNAAMAHESMPVSRTVVTVPASFQTAQRNDTVVAAKKAGIEISTGDLLDEPVAAFIDYFCSYSQQFKGVFASPKKLLVFDFGGGTCDIAIFQLGKSRRGNFLDISPLAVSRYHRLGGGDIDRAILYDILLPQIIEQNGLDPADLTFEDKKNFIEPAFITLAEALKKGLSNEITRLHGLGRYAATDKNSIVKKQPGVYSCQLATRRLELNSPTLSAAQFEKVLGPFLDEDLLYARESEYRLTCSIFAPIRDALDRSNLTPGDIGLCLLVGGSSLIPSIVSAVQSFLPKSKQLMFPDQDAIQVAVARGAATHALSLALYGKGIVQPVTPDRISIRTTDSSYELIPKGTPLPFPGNGRWHRSQDLSVPETSLTMPVPLRIEILAGEREQERRLMTNIWSIAPPVNRGSALSLEYHMDENQLLEFRLTLEGEDDADPFEFKIENPLSNVVNPNDTLLKIQEAEEELRRGKIPQALQKDKIIEIAQDYFKLGQIDKAIFYLSQALRMVNRPDAHILNLLGIYHGEKRDYQRQEKFYREAHRVGGMGRAPLFNLALSQYRQCQYKAAQATVAELRAFDHSGPTLTLAAQIEESLGHHDKVKKIIGQALAEYPPLPAMEQWELGWYMAAARLAGDNQRLAAAQAEQQKRKKAKPRHDHGEDGVLPEIAGAVVRRS